jgi:hypothetical protein
MSGRIWNVRTMRSGKVNVAKLAPDEPHALYRFYGAGGTLLYIGITNEIPRRLKEHNGDKPWWLGVANITVEHYPSRKSVLEAERRAIIAERPLYNDVYNRPGRDWGEARGATTGRLLAICMDCEEEITPGMGALHILEREALAVMRYEMGQGRPDSPLVLLTRSDLLAGPDPVAWQVHCDWCNPHRHPETDDICPSCYAIDVGRCDTWPRLVEWTAHLMEKDWVAAGTNWLSFIRAVASASTRTGLVAATREGVAG